MKRKFFSILKYLVFLLLGIFLLWLVFRKVALQEVIYQFSHANYWWVLASIAFGILSHVARAIRWNLLINSMGYKTRLDSTFYAVMTGYFMNIAVPRLGEITRCGVLSKKDKIPLNALFGSVVAERVFDMITLVLIIFLVIVFQLELVGSFVEEHIFTPLYLRFSNNLSVILILVFALLFLLVLAVVLFRIFLPRLKHKAFVIKMNEFIKGFMEGLKTILRLPNKLAFIFWTLFIWLMYTSMTFIAFYALSATSGLQFIDGLTVMAIGSLGMVAPVPGGIGAYHFFTTLVLFELYGIPKAAAASWATIAHASQGILILAVGSFSYFMILLQIRKKNHGISRSNKVKDPD